MVHVNRNYKYANTLCYAVVMVFSRFHPGQIFHTHTHAHRKRRMCRNKNSYKRVTKRRTWMRLPTSNNLKALLRCQSLWMQMSEKRLRPCSNIPIKERSVDVFWVCHVFLHISSFFSWRSQHKFTYWKLDKPKAPIRSYFAG